MKKETQGTVTIPVEEYNDLRDFKIAIEEEGSLLRKYGAYGIPMYEYYSKNESIQDLNQALKDQTKEADGIIESHLKGIARKSVREFKKWRKTIIT
jgi:hypothetical protein